MVQLWRAFGHLVPLFLIIVLGVSVITYFVSKKRKSDRVIVNLLFIFSIIGILLVTVYPNAYGPGMPRVVNIVPLVGMYNILFHSVDITIPIRNLGLNILLFVPFGFFLTLKTSSFQRKLNLFVILTGFIFSLFIETVQFAIPMGRSSDIDDVILNTIGTFLGYIIWKLFNSKSSSISSFKETSNGKM
ncbi:VanZ family protein [Bacillus salipaludis]|uniref:VanZ family protein n=1 Tax=Bacillus salipaludis TaxID=2547811 RepID=A0AA90TSP2_9BACI|nr:VanZ family protein [Bacillus salipaludis]MDQ6597990.1 VanZ family protein [Bacillus salipaludis]